MGRGGGGSGVEARGQSIRVTFYIGGERFRETLKLKPTPPNVRYAERLKKEIDAKIGAGVFDYAAHFPDSPNLMRLGLAKAKPSFRHYAELWYSSTGALSKGTRIQYRRYLNAVWIPLFGDRRIADIKHSEIAAYVGDHDWHSAKNLNNHLSALRGPFIMARKDRAVPEDPTEGIKNLKYQAPGADPLERD